VRKARTVVLTPEDHATLDAWASPAAPEQRRAIRARIVLEAARGAPNGAIARHLGVHAETVALWRGRFAARGLDGIRHDAPRSGSGRRAEPGLVDRIVRTTLEVEPPSGRWTTRSLAASLHVNHMLVFRVWRSHGLGPGTRVRGAGPGLTAPSAERTDG
jgi:transposase